MSTSMKDQLVEQLDKLLLEQAGAEELAREAMRASDAAQTRVSVLAAEAQKMRMAVFALDGQVDGRYGNGKSPGDANTANSKRMSELKRGGS